MRILLLALLVVLASVGCDRKATTPAGPAESSALSTTLPPLNLRPRGGDFTGATAWLNAERPLVPADLEGRVVVVDFWTSCCINCLHTLPILSALEKRHEADAVLVVGVHSPKFDAETEGERLRSAIVENSITHPVAVDGSMKIWTAWQAQSWPTVFVLDARGRIVWRGSGEPNKDVLEAQVAAALEEGRREGILKTEKLAAVKPVATDTGPLAFPGKIIALEGGAFAVSDTGHHRIVVFDATFAVKEVIGTGLAGMTDGGYAEASFRKPQGLAVSGDLLYVADTENHALRVVDRKARTVKTVAGTGEIAHKQLDERSKARETALRSPWDLVVVKDLVYVALAGSHMIAAFDPRAGTIERWAGDGVERRYDNTGAEASFAQPSGITTDGTTLWVADSETSSIRAVTIATREVKTLVGKDLFVFGDVDGAPDLARLEHPLGIAVLGRALFVADTYNSKIKRLDLATSSVRTLVGARDHKDLFEPSGLVARAAGGGAGGAGGSKDTELIVVDTKHHRLARVLVNAGGDAKVEPIAIRGLRTDERHRRQERGRLGASAAVGEDRGVRRGGSLGRHHRAPDLGRAEGDRRERGGALQGALEEGRRPQREACRHEDDGRHGEEDLRRDGEAVERRRSRDARGGARHGGVRRRDPRRVRAGPSRAGAGLRGHQGRRRRDGAEREAPRGEGLEVSVSTPGRRWSWR